MLVLLSSQFVGLGTGEAGNQDGETVCVCVSVNKRDKQDTQIGTERDRKGGREAGASLMAF